MTELRFFYNGIKVGKGPLQKCGAYITAEGYKDTVAGTIRVYARHYRRLSAEIAAAFAVQNNSDSQTDYFEQDSFKVAPTHPLYAKVKAGMIDAKEAKYAKKEAGKAAATANLVKSLSYVVHKAEAERKALADAKKAKEADLAAKGIECAAEYVRLYGLPKGQEKAFEIVIPDADETEASFADFYS